MSLEPATRRGFLIGLGAVMAAPMIIRAEALMPVKVVDLYDTRVLFDYVIQTDEFMLRVDRRLETLVRPPHAGWTQEAPLSLAKKLFGANHPIFTAEAYDKVTGVSRQLSTWVPVKAQDLMHNGVPLHAPLMPAHSNWTPGYVSRYAEPLVVEGDDSRLFPVTERFYRHKAQT